ncbi:MAG TPA: DUF2279 domain-containing protein [Chryseolinea sp.]|nr:DUF2279 domain-containing protein [Chryseolinea sp.]
MRTPFILIVFGLLLYQHPLMAQPDTTVRKGINKSRFLLTAGAHAGLWVGSFLALNNAWYAGFNRTPFHSFNDNAEWNQMDKAGHIWSTYGLARASAASWRWSGLNPKAAAMMGAGGGILYESIIELQDAYSAAWGFSWGDMAANLFGASLFAFQDIHWKEQRVQMKMSYWPADYSSATRQRRDELFGTSLPEHFLKDYNSQTYWLSVNLRSFAKDARIPAWLNLQRAMGLPTCLVAAPMSGPTRKEGLLIIHRLRDFDVFFFRPISISQEFL